MVTHSPSDFRPFLQEFFVKASDPLFTCTIKLDVLTALATKENCATILGELQTYVLHRDKSFVCAAVRAVGRIADARPEAADQCLQVRKRKNRKTSDLETQDSSLSKLLTLVFVRGGCGKAAVFYVRTYLAGSCIPVEYSYSCLLWGDALFLSDGSVWYARSP